MSPQGFPIVRVNSIKVLVTNLTSYNYIKSLKIYRLRIVCTAYYAVSAAYCLALPLLLLPIPGQSTMCPLSASGS